MKIEAFRTIIREEVRTVIKEELSLIMSTPITENKIVKKPVVEQKQRKNKHFLKLLMRKNNHNNLKNLLNHYLNQKIL